MKVQGHIQMTSQSQVNMDNLLMLHFILQSIEGMGSPAHLLYQYMQGFIHPSHVVAKCLSSIETRHVVIFITNHSDENRGDLFVSPGSCATVIEVSYGQSEGHIEHMPPVYGCPFTNAFATFLHGKEVTLWMMSCGALVSSQESYTQLVAEVQWQVTDFPCL